MQTKPLHPVSHVNNGTTPNQSCNQWRHARSVMQTMEPHPVSHAGSPCSLHPHWHPPPKAAAPTPDDRSTLPREGDSSHSTASATAGGTSKHVCWEGLGAAVPLSYRNLGQKHTLRNTALQQNRLLGVLGCTSPVLLVASVMFCRFITSLDAEKRHQ
jgi:hypothetical protein